MRTNVPGGLRVVAVRPDGSRVAESRLGHGEHPDVVLGAAGWLVETPVFATVVADGALELGYRVRELDGIRPRAEAVRRDAGVGDDEVGDPFQRVAAYAVVTSERGVLLTQFNARTHVPGDWGLPGGGLDDGESPVDGVHREVWEETGQRIELGELLTVQSQHWVGRAPSGGLEDFHAVRIVYAATCPEPGAVVIHDVGGTTSDARWVPFDRIGDYPLTSSWRRLAALQELAVPPGS
ncbi:MULTISPECIES: NUDIX hydrolase [unclassified Terrabacter]|uniref:NUDIX hydrolase n=1 Tax=unclassified Terrabacter TaxID=2630222 RepID=UPI0006FE276B|nr:MULTISPECIES: NUDIX domain-containing protein [unclassified Terrabacter]KRB43354.1 NUDIX hydrolase [Terrabacter sp. Root181]KRF46151.1 NUDIX hydrolase [Terrabacter sp. Soil810]